MDNQTVPVSSDQSAANEVSSNQEVVTPGQEEIKQDQIVELVEKVDVKPDQLVIADEKQQPASTGEVSQAEVSPAELGATKDNSDADLGTSSETVQQNTEELESKLDNQKIPEPKLEDVSETKHEEIADTKHEEVVEAKPEEACETKHEENVEASLEEAGNKQDSIVDANQEVSTVGQEEIKQDQVLEVESEKEIAPVPDESESSQNLNQKDASDANQTSSATTFEQGPTIDNSDVKLEASSETVQQTTDDSDSKLDEPKIAETNQEKVAQTRSEEVAQSKPEEVDQTKNEEIADIKHEEVNIAKHVEGNETKHEDNLETKHEENVEAKLEEAGNKQDSIVEASQEVSTVGQEEIKQDQVPVVEEGKEVSVNPVGSESLKPNQEKAPDVSQATSALAAEQETFFDSAQELPVEADPTNVKA